MNISKIWSDIFGQKSWTLDNLFDVHPDEVQGVIRGSRLGAFVAIVNAILITLCIWPNGNPNFMASWLVVSIGLYVYIAIRAFRVRQKLPERVSRRAIYRMMHFSMLYAAPWVVLAVVTIMEDNPNNILLVMMLCAGMSAGGGLMLHRVPVAAMSFAGFIVFSVLGTIAFKDIATLWPMVIYSLTYAAILSTVILKTWRLARDREESLIEASNANAKLQAANEKINRLAVLDPLTGLVNRKVFIDELERWVAKGWYNKFAVLLLDLDRFKHVNDSLGHLAGDELLKTVTARLKQSVRETDVVARFGGDEFALMIDLNDTSSSAEKVANKILKTLNTPVTIERAEILPNASIGIVLCPEHTFNPGEFIRLADIALRRAKEKGKGRFELYTAEMAISVSRMDEIEQTLKNALDKKQLAMFYQPKFILQTGELAGAEAVLKWLDREQVSASPRHMIEVAEVRGMIPELSQYIFESILEDIKILRNNGAANIPISLNVHGFDMKSPELLIKRIRELEKAGLPLSDIILEISESCFLGRGSDEIRTVFDMINDMGVKLTLDEFGAGKAALSHIRGLPIGEIKIDRQYTRNLLGNPYDKAMLTATLEFANCLGIDCTVTNIKTECQADIIKEMNPLGTALICQGVLWEEPMLAKEFAKYAALKKEDSSASHLTSKQTPSILA